MASIVDAALVSFVEQVNRDAHSGDLPFFLDLCRVPDGSMQGKIALSVLPRDGFRFLDLPAEIRNRVYNHLFLRNKPIQLSLFVSAAVKAKVVMGTRGQFRSRTGHGRFTWCPSRAKWHGAPPTEFALLTVSKQINLEATPIAYGVNPFVMDSMVLPHWAKRSDMHFKHLTNITIHDCPKHALEVIGELEKCTSLRKITLDYEFVTKSVRIPPKKEDTLELRAEILARQLKRVLLALHKAYKREGRSWKALDAVHFKTPRKDLAAFNTFAPLFREAANVYLKEE